MQEEFFRAPRGPTLTCRIDSYSLASDVAASLRKPHHASAGVWQSFSSGGDGKPVRGLESVCSQQHEAVERVQARAVQRVAELRLQQLSATLAGQRHDLERARGAAQAAQEARSLLQQVRAALEAEAAAARGTARLAARCGTEILLAKLLLAFCYLSQTFLPLD